MEAMRAFLTGQAPIYRVDYRIRKADGNYTWYVDRGIATARDADGRPIVVRGFVFDLGEHLERNALNDEMVARVRRAFSTQVVCTPKLSFCSFSESRVCGFQAVDIVYLLVV